VPSRLRSTEAAPLRRSTADACLGRQRPERCVPRASDRTAPRTKREICASAARMSVRARAPVARSRGNRGRLQGFSHAAGALLPLVRQTLSFPMASSRLLLQAAALPLALDRCVPTPAANSAASAGRPGCLMDLPRQHIQVVVLSA